MKLNRLLFSSLVLSLVCGLGACSKKKTTDNGDVAADTTAAATTPVDTGPAVGTPIPELGAVYFAYDSFNLTPASKTALNKHIEWLKANPNRSVQIEGHTDERGTTEYNLALGERRSGAVKEYLTGKGIPASQLSTISYGEERPAVQGSTEASWSKNRRAEFVSAGK